MKNEGFTPQIMGYKTTKNEGGGFPWMLVKSLVLSHPNIPHVYNYHSLAHDPNFHGKIISVVG